MAETNARTLTKYFRDRNLQPGGAVAGADLNINLAPRVRKPPGSEPVFPPDDKRAAAKNALPPGWEERRDPKSGRPFYVNHATKTTSWERPSAEKPAIDPEAPQFRFQKEVTNTNVDGAKQQLRLNANAKKIAVSGRVNITALERSQLRLKSGKVQQLVVSGTAGVHGRKGPDGKPGAHGQNAQGRHAKGYGLWGMPGTRGDKGESGEDGTFGQPASNIIITVSGTPDNLQLDIQETVRKLIPQQPTCQKPIKVQADVVPAGWEMKRDPRTQKVFYIDHNTKTTSWEKPVIYQCPNPRCGSMMAQPPQNVRVAGFACPGCRLALADPVIKPPPKLEENVKQEVKRVSLKPGESFVVVARGGDGGNGGDGGKGGPGGVGGSGYPGIDKPARYNWNTGPTGGNGGKGAKGMNGGPGGNGGRPGRGGDGGSVIFQAREKDAGLLFLLTADTRGGQVGIAGKPGAGGPGGAGGRGGAGGKGGAGKYSAGPYGRTGANGADGPKGEDGKPPLPSKSGQDGNVLYRVLSDSGSVVFEAKELFTANVASFTVNDPNGWGVFSPGSTITIDSVQVKNRGGLPIPGGAQLDFVASDVLIPVAAQPETLPTLPKDEAYLCKNTWQLTIPALDPATPPPPTPIQSVLKLSPQITVMGLVCPESKLTVEIPIQFPVQIRETKYNVRARPLSSSPCLIILENSANATFGRKAGVKVRVIASVRESNVATLLISKRPPKQQPDPNVKPKRPKGKPSIVLEIKKMLPGAITGLGFGVQFEKEVNVIAHVDVELHLGEQIIQKQTLVFNVEPSFVPGLKADVLLAFGPRTDKAKLLRWRKWLDFFGLQANLWDMSLYQSLYDFTDSWAGCKTLIVEDIIKSTVQHSLWHQDWLAHIKDPKHSALFIGLDEASLDPLVFDYTKPLVTRPLISAEPVVDLGSVATKIENEWIETQKRDPANLYAASTVVSVTRGPCRNSLHGSFSLYKSIEARHTRLVSIPATPYELTELENGKTLSGADWVLLRAVVAALPAKAALKGLANATRHQRIMVEGNRAVPLELALTQAIHFVAERDANAHNRTAFPYADSFAKAVQKSLKKKDPKDPKHDEKEEKPIPHRAAFLAYVAIANVVPNGGPAEFTAVVDKLKKHLNAADVAAAPKLWSEVSSWQGNPTLPTFPAASPRPEKSLLNQAWVDWAASVQSFRPSVKPPSGPQGAPPGPQGQGPPGPPGSR